MPNPAVPRRQIGPARVYALGTEPPASLAAETTVEARLEMVAVLTRRAWELSNRPWPTRPRSEWPVRIVSRTA